MVCSTRARQLALRPAQTRCIMHKVSVSLCYTYVLSPTPMTIHRSQKPTRQKDQIFITTRANSFLSFRFSVTWYGNSPLRVISGPAKRIVALWDCGRLMIVQNLTHAPSVCSSLFSTASERTLKLSAPFKT